MAEAKFTHGRGWKTSSLPGPPTRSSTEEHPPLRFRRSLPLYDAGPFAELLVREALYRADQLTAQIRAISKYVEGDYREDAMIRTGAERIHEINLMLLAYLDHDSMVSVGYVLRRLREMRACTPIEEVMGGKKFVGGSS